MTKRNQFLVNVHLKPNYSESNYQTTCKHVSPRILFNLLQVLNFRKKQEKKKSPRYEKEKRIPNKPQMSGMPKTDRCIVSARKKKSFFGNQQTQRPKFQEPTKKYSKNETNWSEINQIC